MSDNPLADWLRERGAWAGDDDAGSGPATVLGPAVPADGDPQEPQQAVDDPRPPAGPRPPDWLDEPLRPPARSRRLLLVGLAAVPWLGLVALALLTLPPDSPDAADADGDAAPDHASGSEPASGAVREPAGERGDGPDDAGGQVAEGQVTAPVPPTGADAAGTRAEAERRAAAAATVAIRSELTGELPGEPAAGRYVDLAVAEAVDWVEDVAVVAVAAVVLESTGDEWGEARAARFGVPVRVSGSVATPIGRPWPLPPPPEGQSPSWEAVDDADVAAAVAAALSEGGFSRVGEVSVTRSDDVPGVLAAKVVAIAPGATDPGTHTVWLRDGDPPSLLAGGPANAEEDAG